MGSYSAPISAPVFLKELVDNTWNDDDEIMNFYCTRFKTMYLTSALWDGEIKGYFQATDDTWIIIDLVDTSVSRQWNLDDAVTPIRYQQTPPGKYPYHIKVVVETAPTVGTCTCWATYEKRPANPLF